MKTKKKLHKLISVLLCCVLMLGLMPITAFAADTPVTKITASVTAPVLGQTPDYAPVIVGTPADSVILTDVEWFKCDADSFTDTEEDTWEFMEADEVFAEGYYYSVDMLFFTEDGYKITEATTGTVNGMPHNDAYGGIYDGDNSAYLCGVFEPLTDDYIINMPVSIFVQLTGDQEPAKEEFKFEIYDLGYEDTEYEFLNDTIIAEDLEFDEDGIAYVYGMLKIQVPDEEQLFNISEGFNVRMIEGSTEGWTYASEQWHIDLYFLNDALDFTIGVMEIVDGDIYEGYDNLMSYNVGYEAVAEIDPLDPNPTDPTNPNQPTQPTQPTKTNTSTKSPQTGADSMMWLCFALMLVSVTGFAGVTLYSKRKKAE